MQKLTLPVALALAVAATSGQALELVVRASGIEARGTPTRGERGELSDGFARRDEDRRSARTRPAGTGALLLRVEALGLRGPVVDALKDGDL